MPGCGTMKRNKQQTNHLKPPNPKQNQNQTNPDLRRLQIFVLNCEDYPPVCHVYFQ